MKKWLLFFCLLALSACGAEETKKKTSAGEGTISIDKAEEIAMDVIKEVWMAYEDIGAEAPIEEKRERLVTFMTDEMFNKAFQKTQEPEFPQLPVHTFGVHVTENKPDSFEIEHIIPASTEEGPAVKQTVRFIKQRDRFIMSDYQKEDKALSLSKEEAETFLAEHGYEAVFLKEGPFDAVSTRIEDAYIFHDQEDPRIQFVISKKTGYFLMGVVRGAMDEESETDAAATEEVRVKYGHLFAYRLTEIDEGKLSDHQRKIYNTYIIKPIEQVIDIDFDASLTDDERNQKTKELLDHSIMGMLAEIEDTLDAKEIAVLRENHAKWEIEREKYADEIAGVSKSDQTNHFYAAYKEVTEDYLAYLFYEYIYQ